MKKLLGIPIIPVAPQSPASQKPGFSFFEAMNKYSAAQHEAQSAATDDTSRPTNQRIPPSSVLSQRIRSLEKQVKEKKKGSKKR